MTVASEAAQQIPHEPQANRRLDQLIKTFGPAGSIAVGGPAEDTGHAAVNHLCRAMATAAVYWPMTFLGLDASGKTDPAEWPPEQSSFHRWR